MQLTFRGFVFRCRDMIQNSSKHWTSEEDRRLRELIHSKVTPFDIAVELGRSVSAVKAHAQLLRITLRRLQPDGADRPLEGRRAARSWTEQEVKSAHSRLFG